MICVLCLVLTLLPTTVFALWTTPTLDVDASYEEATNKVKATVTIGAHEVGAINFTLNYDSTKLAINGTPTGQGFFASATIGTLTAGKIIGAWADISGATSSEEVQILSVTFDVISGMSGDVLFSIDNISLTDISGDNEETSAGAGSNLTKSVTIPAPPIPATGIVLNKTETTIYIGANETLTATVTPDDTTDTVTWESSNTDVATVDNGTVTAKAEGTATITAKAGTKSATCTVTVEEAPCTHKNKESVSAKESTCVEQGWDEYYKCNDCGQLLDKDGNVISEIPYRELAEHTPVQTAGDEYLKSAATCTSKAVYNEHCSVCDEKLETTFEDGEPAAHTESAWKSDADGHWKVCTVCGAITTVKTAHTPNHEGHATEEYPITCSECGWEIEKQLAHVHNMTKVDRVDATCTDDGNIEYYVCGKCGNWYEDEDGTVQIADHDSVVKKALDHKWKDATCTDPKTCERCSATEGEALGHSYSDKWTHDDTEHWHECTSCGQKNEDSIEKHSFTTPNHDDNNHWMDCKCGAKDGVTAHTLTPIEKDATGHKLACGDDDCGYSKTEAHTPVIRDAEEATYEKPGYTGDTYCSVCDYEIAKGEEIPKLEYIILFPPVTDIGGGSGSGTGTEGGTETEPEQPDEWINPFEDVTEDDEYYEAVRFANENGLIIGLSDTEFAPEVIMNRAMFVTILGRAEGIPADNAFNGTFEDVVADTWYTAYVDWADQNRIITGYSESAFGPEDNITVEQACVIMARYAAYLGYDVTVEPLDAESGYADIDDISDWAVDGMAWAVQSGIYTTTDGELRPGAPASRAMVAMMLYRLSGVVTEFIK